MSDHFGRHCCRRKEKNCLNGRTARLSGVDGSFHSHYRPVILIVVVVVAVDGVDAVALGGASVGLQIVHRVFGSHPAAIAGTAVAMMNRHKNCH